MKKNNWISPGKRIMDIAYLRDGDTLYTGEALVLACLLHAKGKTKRGNDEVAHIAKMLDDPNAKKQPRK